MGYCGVANTRLLAKIPQTRITLSHLRIHFLISHTHIETRTLSLPFRTFHDSTRFYVYEILYTLLISGFVNEQATKSKYRLERKEYREVLTAMCATLRYPKTQNSNKPIKNNKFSNLKEKLMDKNEINGKKQRNEEESLDIDQLNEVEKESDRKENSVREKSSCSYKAQVYEKERGEENNPKIMERKLISSGTLGKGVLVKQRDIEMEEEMDSGKDESSESDELTEMEDREKVERKKNSILIKI